jgi:hypothetical protein
MEIELGCEDFHQFGHAKTKEDDDGGEKDIFITGGHREAPWGLKVLDDYIKHLLPLRVPLIFSFIAN